MSLFKGNREDVPAKSLIKKSTIVRAADVGLAPQADTETSLEDTLPLGGNSSSGKVFGARTTMTSTATNLPPIAQSVRIPTGGPEAAASPMMESHMSGGVGMAPSAAAPTSGPAYSSPVPVDKQIVEEAQMRAQQMLQDAQNAANQMLLEYQAQAQAMMEQANQQIQAAAQQIQMQAQEQGFQQGYQQGLEAGAQAGQQQVGQLLYQVRDLYVQSIKQRQWLLQSVEPELARLSVKVAEKIVGQEVKLNPELIVGIIKSALSGLGDREEVSVRVNPKDLEVAQANKPMFERMVEGLKKFEVVGDAAIDEGGCAIETNLGNVDARLVTQLNTLAAAMEEQAKLHEKEIQEDIEAQAAALIAENPPPDMGGEEPQEG